MDRNDLSWIHISDLHFFVESDTNILLADLKTLAERLSPSFMIITGDLRNIKTKEYDQALDILPKILSIFNLKKKDVFMVPGNHDVSALMEKSYRSSRTKIINKIVAKQKASISGNYNALSDFLYDGHAPLIDAFDEYSSFVKKFYYGSGLKSDDDRLTSSTGVFSIKWMNKINIVHLNTALISNGKHDHKQMCDINGLTKCSIDSKLPTIMIGHHNLADIYDSQVERILRIAELKNISAYFSGDIHKFELGNIDLRKPYDRLPCYSCPKSVPQAGDSYSEIGLMYYTWNPELDSKVEVQAFGWKIGKGFLPNNDYIYDVDEKEFFYIKIPQIETSEPILNNSLIIDRQYVDSVAQDAHDSMQSTFIANAILLQEKNNSRQRNPSLTYDMIYNKINTSKHKCPLIIYGRPGTGKSTLLSLLYLRLHDNNSYWTYYLDLQSFDENGSDYTSEQLEKEYCYIGDNISKNSKVMLFIDGLNEYSRLKPKHEQKLRKQIDLWQAADNVQIICSIGIQDTNHYPPFIRFASNSQLESESKIELVPIDTISSRFSNLTNKVLEFKCVYTKQKAKTQDAKHKLRDRFINFCNLLDGGNSTFRSILFLVDRCNHQQDDILSQPVAIVLKDYFYSFLSQKNLSKIAREAAEFLLNEKGNVKLSIYCLKSDAFLDFFFALSYIDFLVQYSGKKIPSEKLKKYNSIFTARINRFVVQLVCSDASLEEKVLYTIWENFANMPMKAKNQAVYLLGRFSDKNVKALAEDFLLKQFKEALEEYSSSAKTNDEAMLLRSMGISLLKLGCNKHEDEFYELLIFDENMSRINRHFHITYYMNDSYKLTDDDVVDNRIVYDFENIKRTYDFLFHSIEINEAPPHKCVNIITIIDLVLNFIYSPKSKRRSATEYFDNFRGLINKLSADVTLVNRVVKRYVLDLNYCLKCDDPYVLAFSQIYRLKDQLRKGWLKPERAINIKRRTESVADHVWACCLLAQMLLPENIHDSNLIDKEECSSESDYSKQKVISLLLVHDLPESITGDIPFPDKTQNHRVEEKKAIATIGTLAAFPSLSPMRSVVKLWQEYTAAEQSKSISVKLAYDIDKLEPLIQLYLYREDLAVPNDYSVAKNWISSLNLKTHFGLNLLNLISLHFINPEAFGKETDV